MTSTKKIIAIVGATGRQGASVARTFLRLPNWHVRCLTRNSGSEKAQKLTEVGAEVVEADLNDKESLHRAFAGANAIFLNTDFWQPYRDALASGVDAPTSAKQGYDAETTHGENAANVAATIPTLEKLIYSALGPMKRVSGGKYSSCFHWDAKAQIVDYIETQQPELAKKTSFIYISCYISNPFLYPKYQSEKKEFVYILPASKAMRMPIIDTAQSTGPFVRALVEDEVPGMKLLAYDDYVSVEQLMETWTRVLGKPVEFIQKTVKDMNEKLGLPVEVLSGPAFVDEFGYFAGLENVVEPTQLKSHVQGPKFEEWLKSQDVEELLGLKESNNWDGLVQ
ncbi:uncharacterized protein N7479_010847 [Penicillium vulpinum]|uniref:NmrA-like domain-containing protein n=1 Tax=Penicillium vulpinum TaxID=29845 RepID=A0A1V6RZR0_9EURO|nr:uncharacterized protein N7479_010847 [Penicillium vulpinum]KAJ5952434.1 hypothetical protein N7479_010847 [Penicillium vulpinum]OQE07245.1 hypothetical protein PENVUL_c014G04614 [Penicillium vulpinum]